MYVSHNLRVLPKPTDSLSNTFLLHLGDNAEPSSMLHPLQERVRVLIAVSVVRRRAVISSALEPLHHAYRVHTPKGFSRVKLITQCVMHHSS